MLGVVQEQHAERAQLFANWQELDFPILHDPINQLGCQAVPITIAIDRQGVVRNTRPTPEWVREQLVGSVSSSKAVEETSHKAAARPHIGSLQTHAHVANSATTWRQFGDAIMLWQPEQSTKAIEAYHRSRKLAATPELDFRLGVAFRQRSESADRQRNDFSQAVTHWTQALRQKPNQYIWRRRIQQYGPRLDKPYPFYDWVGEAREAITARDGTPPAPLRVPLSGAEIAKPNGGDNGSATPDIRVAASSPDPENRIHRDTQGLVGFAGTVVSDSHAQSSSYRLHLQFSLSDQAVWNNEAETLQVWFEDTEGVTMEKRRLRHEPRVTSAESNEIRILDVEFTKKGDVKASIRGFALYYVCENSTQQCILLRQDFAIPVRID